MKKSHLVAALAAVVIGVGLLGYRTAAQQPAYRPAAGAPIAVVDIAFLFKKNPRFMAQMQEMRQDVENVKADYRRKGEQLQKQADSLKELRPGTPEYHRAEEDLFRKQSELKSEMTISEKEFVERDAKVHYAIYQEIWQEVKYYCEANGIAVAINFNGERINPEQPEDVLRGIKQNVVYSHKDLDITPYILQRLAPPETARGVTTGPMGVSPR